MGREREKANGRLTPVNTGTPLTQALSNADRGPPVGSDGGGDGSGKGWGSVGSGRGGGNADADSHRRQYDTRNEEETQRKNRAYEDEQRASSDRVEQREREDRERQERVSVDGLCDVDYNSDFRKATNAGRRRPVMSSGARKQRWVEGRWRIGSDCSGFSGGVSPPEGAATEGRGEEV